MASRRLIGQLQSSGSGRVNPTFDLFDADGVETEFTIAAPGTIYLVEVGGQLMRRYLDYDIDDNETIRFLEAPHAGATIGVYYFARHRVRSAYTADNAMITADSTLITADAL